jgi:hypothetical protein
MLTASDLSKIINKNGGNLLDTIAIESIRSFKRLQRDLPQTNAAEDETFQQAFKSYFRLSGTGVNQKFIQSYFEYLEKVKNDEEFDFRNASLRLYGARPKRKLSSAQFGFLTKMANLIHPEKYPVYDNHVADIFEFDKPVQTTLDTRERLNRYLEFHTYMISIYEELIREAMLHDTLVVFKILLRKYKDDEFPEIHLPDMKKVDFLVETASNLQEQLV